MAKKTSEFDRDAKTPETKPRGKAATDEGEQPDLIDVDHDEDKPLIKQARKVRSAGRAESEARDKSTVERTKLIDMMKERKIDHYKFGDVVVDLKLTEKVSVKSADDENGDN